VAADVALHLTGGVSVAGGRVVSAANLAECSNPPIDLPTSPELP
jgi:hypothetical protein